MKTITWFFTTLAVCSCASIADQEKMMRVAEASYYEGCVYGADKLSVKYLECYTLLKKFSRDLRKPMTINEAKDLEKKYGTIYSK